MGPQTAFGLASNILTFVDFASKVISSAHTFYVSGTGKMAGNMESQSVTLYITALAKKAARRDEPTAFAMDQTLVDLENQCHTISTELLST